MFTPRGVTVCVAGVAMWLVARLIGSAGLEVVGIGFVLLPIVAGFFLRWTERRVSVRRRLSDVRVGPGARILFGSALTGLGLVYLAACVNVRAALVTTVVVVLYLFAYTPLKLRTPLSTLVGAVPGALPPVTGWVAARGDVVLGAAVLFGILFLWQLPHTLAIARLYRDDYARAGVRVLPVVDRDGDSTERQIVIGCLALLAVGLLPTLSGLAGATYFGGALILGLVFLAFGMAQAVAPSTTAARRVLFASLLYLPALLVLLALDKS